MLPLYENKDLVKELSSLKVKGKVEKGSAIGWLIFVATLFAGRHLGYVKDIVADEAQIISAILVMLGIGGMHISERNALHINDLAEDIKQATNQDCNIKSLDDIEIVPKNIQVGENLEAINIIPIFKEGHYIIIKSRPASFVLRQVEIDGEREVQILESEEANAVIDELVNDDIEFVVKNVVMLKKSIERMPE